MDYLQQLTLQHSTKLLFVYKLIIGCQCRQEMGKIPNFTDSERFKTPKTDFLLKCYKDKEVYQLVGQFAIMKLQKWSTFLNRYQ